MKSSSRGTCLRSGLPPPPRRQTCCPENMQIPHRLPAQCSSYQVRPLRWFKHSRGGATQRSKSFEPSSLQCSGLTTTTVCTKSYMVTMPLLLTCPVSNSGYCVSRSSVIIFRLRRMHWLLPLGLCARVRQRVHHGRLPDTTPRKGFSNNCSASAVGEVPPRVGPRGAMQRGWRWQRRP